MYRPLDEPSRSPRWIVALILLIALGVRLGWGLSRSADPATIANLPDQVEYLSLSKSLLAGNGLSMIDPRFDATVYAFRMPGYPFVCAALNANITLIRIAQALIGTTSVLATFWLARRWLSCGYASLAALIVSLDPIQIYFSGLILSETIFTAMIVWGIACLAHGRSPMARGPGAISWWIGVSLLVLSVYVRPSALIWPIVIVGASVIHDHATWRFMPARGVPMLTLVALLTAVALLPWAIRNRTVLGHFLFTTTNDGFTLYDSWNRDADGRSDQSVLKQLPLLPGLSEIQRSAYLRDLAWDSVIHDPARLMRKMPTNLGRLWTPWPLSAEFGANRLYVIGSACHAIPLMVLALIGLLRTSLPHGGKLLLVTPVLLVTIAHGLTIGSLRYRMPVHPELAILAASALVRHRNLQAMVDSEPTE